ncbi:MAG: hypothetical protein R3F39_20830 [Myxococcota bacterium]
MGTPKPPLAATDAPPGSPSAGPLLAYRLRALRRRASWVGGGASAAIAVLALLGAGALALSIDSSVATDLAGPDPAAASASVRERSFWYLVLASLVFSYTTFETLFRAPDTRFVARLPIRGRSRWLDLCARSLALHLPLLFPGAALSISLLLHGATDTAAHVALTHGLVFALGLAASARLHLLAGRSLLGEATAFRHALAGGLVSDDAAFLLYSPAAGLTVSLISAVVLDALLSRSLGLGPLPASPGLTLTLAISVAAAAFYLVRDAALEADRTLPFVIPRFAELDVAPPYREDGLPAHTPGEDLQRFLPQVARPYFLNNLRQLRRRHRLDRILLWLYAAWLARAVIFARPTAPATELASTALTGLAVLVGVFLVSAFRLRGPELAAPALHATLPLDPRGASLGELAASIIHPLWAAALAALAVTVAAGPLPGAATLALGALLCVALTLAARALASVATARLPAMAVAWRAAVILAAALASSPAPWSST